VGNETIYRSDEAIFSACEDMPKPSLDSNAYRLKDGSKKAPPTAKHRK
jgi:hypothetical protein